MELVEPALAVLLVAWVCCYDRGPFSVLDWLRERRLMPSCLVCACFWVSMGLHLAPWVKGCADTGGLAPFRYEGVVRALAVAGLAFSIGFFVRQAKLQVGMLEQARVKN